MASRIPIGQFLDSLRWLDGSPLQVEPYRRQAFEAFNGRDTSARLLYTLGLFGRAKKNYKTLDAMVEATYAVFDDSARGSQVYVVANDEDQAGDDLDLLAKLFRANPRLHALVDIKRNRIERKDGGGFIEVLPAQDAIGAHGKTYRLLVCDEIHGWKTWDLLEALAPDPHRPDAQQWLTSYATLHHRPGVPLFDLMAIGKARTDPRMLFSWYASDFTTDPAFTDLPPEQRANPSMGSWPEGAAYLEQQRRRLPTHKYNRLHLNLPGSPMGAAYQAESVMAAVERGVTARPYRTGVRYHAFVDMSGGSSDDACLAIAHGEPDMVVLDRVVNQGAAVPFDPREAVTRFAALLKDYRLTVVTGDKYAGETFVRDFQRHGIRYVTASKPKSDLYDDLEPRLNGHRVRLLDVPVLEQQLLGLAWRGGRIDHAPGEHDDWANAAVGACMAVAAPVASAHQVPVNGYQINRQLAGRVVWNPVTSSWMPTGGTPVGDPAHWGDPLTWPGLKPEPR